MISLQPHHIFFSKFDKVERVPQQENQLKNLIYNELRKSNNELSEQIKSKIKKNFTWMLKKSINKFIEVKGKTFRHKVSFITLTLPSKQTHTDNEIKKCLNQLFTEFQKIHLLQNYIWKAERQKNGNIHFHILTDSFIPWNVLKKKWNRIIEKLNYITEFSKQMQKLTYKKYLEKYNYEHTDKRQNYFISESRTGWRNPNSVDVRNVVAKKQAEIYLLKYINKPTSKEDNSEEKVITGKRVGFSEKLSQIRFLNASIVHAKDKLFNYFFKFLDVKLICTDYGTLMCFENIVDYADKFLGGEISQFFEEFIKYEPSVYYYDYNIEKFNSIIHKS